MRCPSSSSDKPPLIRTSTCTESRRLASRINGMTNQKPFDLWDLHADGLPPGLPCVAGDAQAWWPRSGSSLVHSFGCVCCFAAAGGVRCTHVAGQGTNIHKCATPAGLVHRPASPRLRDLFLLASPLEWAACPPGFAGRPCAGTPPLPPLRHSAVGGDIFPLAEDPRAYE